MAFFFGVMFITEVLLVLVFGADYRSVDAAYIGPDLQLGSIDLPIRMLVPFGVSLALIAGLQAFLTRTYLGRAVLAVSQDQMAPRLMSTSPYRTKLFAFALSIATGAIAGALMIVIEPVEPSLGRDFIGRPFAVVVLGGMGSLPGMLVAAILLGVAESLTSTLYDPSLAPAGYGVEDLSAQLHEVMLREGIARAHLMGISLGGLVAQHFAATWPAMVDHLVLADTTPRYTEEMRAGWTVRAKMARDNGAASLLPLIEKSWFTPGFVAAGGPAIRFTRATFEACGGEGCAKACEALGAADLRALAPDIKAPTLVFCGSDESVAFKEAAQWLGEHIAGSRVETIPVAGHATVLEQPEHVATLVRAFLG